MTTKKDIALILKDLQHLPNSPIHDMNIDRIVEQYHVDLGDLPGDVLTAAAIHYRTSPNPFFPTSGQLREKATDLMLLSMGVPTAAEAWAQVLTAIRLVDSVHCESGYELWKATDGKANGEYWAAIFAYRQHLDTCQECAQGGFREVYSHPVVANVVKRLGGRDQILTDNLTADRAQFIRAYTEIVAQETKKAALPEPVKEAVASIAGQQMKALAEGMTKRV